MNQHLVNWLLCKKFEETVAKQNGAQHKLNNAVKSCQYEMDDQNNEHMDRT